MPTATVQTLHGKYYAQAYKGKLWSASITTASAIPIFATNATPNFFIWNPPSNKTNVVLVRLNLGLVGGTGVAGAIGYSYITPITALTGTAAPISAATVSATILNANATAYTGNVVFGTAATISGTAPYALKQWRWSNLSQGAPLTGTAAVYSLYEEFDGSMIVEPGTFWCPTAGTAIAETVVMSLLAYEV